MKNLLTMLILFCCFVNIFAQAKSGLFVGIYETNKRGICGDYELVHTEMTDYAEYVSKRNKFIDEHTKQNPSTKFVESTESVIAYQYEKKIAGWDCRSKVVSVKIGKSIEDCNKQLADQLSKYPNDFTTTPTVIFTWQGKNNGMVEYEKDFGGLNGKFTSGSTSTKSIIVAKLKNNTTNKLAYVLLKIDSGAETVEYIGPGSALIKKYDTKNLEIKVIYLDSKKPKPTIDVIQKMKNYVQEIVINENGKLKSKPTASSGVRG